jgi:ribonuclease HII
MPDFELEYDLINQGYRYICGVDEVGRGGLAGPVTAAAVVIDMDLIDVYVKYAKDSKKLSEKKRKELYDLILTSSDCCVISLDNHVVDDINILNATKLVMSKAIHGLHRCDYALIDGNMSFENLGLPYRSVVKGDDKSASIACASIIAKVTRDAFMVNMSKEFPQYGFEKHKGYGTKQHKKALNEYGPCEYHRFTFNGV